MLTRESILAMEPGRELDALVAEHVMGLKLPNQHNARFYSTDISAAWEVVEKLRASGWYLRLNIGLNITSTTFVKESGGKFECIQSNSTTIAVCLAALLTTISGEDEKG